MPKRKNLRLYIKEGDIIRTPDNELYEVLFLSKDNFQCRNILFIGSDHEIIQRFNYNTPMVIFREYSRNVFG